MEQKTWDSRQALWSCDPVTEDPTRRLERKRARQDCECQELYQHRTCYLGGLFFGHTGRPEDGAQERAGGWGWDARLKGSWVRLQPPLLDIGRLNRPLGGTTPFWSQIPESRSGSPCPESIENLDLRGRRRMTACDQQNQDDGVQGQARQSRQTL